MGHAQWVFTVPKMLRVYFLHHRELLGELSRAAAATVKELLATAAGEEEGFRPGMVSVVRRIVGHLRKRDRPARPPPPGVHQPMASPA